jgi:hypothetical protein
MDTQEFYIRQASDNEARGPYNLEQLISLSKNGGVTGDTLFYDASSEKWTPIGESADLEKTIFFEKDKRSIQGIHTVPLGTYAIIAMLVISAAAEIAPSVTGFKSFTAIKLKQQPLIFLGTLDLLIALFSYLSAVKTYPLIRVRAACGVVLFGSIFFLQARYGLMLAAIAGSVGLYLTTVLVAPLQIRMSYATGLIGLGCVAWHYIYS